MRRLLVFKHYLGQKESDRASQRDHCFCVYTWTRKSVKYLHQTVRSRTLRLMTDVSFKIKSDLRKTIPVPVVLWNIQGNLELSFIPKLEWSPRDEIFSMCHRTNTIKRVKHIHTKTEIEKVIVFLNQENICFMKLN